jgi:hypothetical protein
MDLLGKISCFSLVLLHCVIKFRLDGKILQNNPQVGFCYNNEQNFVKKKSQLALDYHKKCIHLCFQSLVGILVSHSLQLFEMELLHGLAELAGKYCDFEPTSPLNGVRSLIGNNKGLIDSIKAIMGSNSPRFKCPVWSLEAENSSKGNTTCEIASSVHIYKKEKCLLN